MSAGQPLERAAPWIVALLFATPTLAMHYLPMSDLAIHEGVVGLLRHGSDPEFFPAGLYQKNLGHPNQLFHLAAWALSYMVGTTWAVKIVVAAAQIAIFGSGARLADHMGRSRWSVLLLAPLALGYTYYWGLVANLVGFGAFLFALPVLDAATARPSGRGFAASLGVLALLFFAHESVFFAAIGFGALLAILHPGTARERAMRGAPFGIALALAIAQFVWSLGAFTRGQAVAPPTFPSPIEKLGAIPTVLFGSHDLPVRILLLLVALLTIVLCVIARRADEPDAGDGTTRARILGRRFEIVAVAFVVGYFVLPFNWKGTTLLYERFLGPAWAILAIVSAPRAAPPRIVKLLCAVTPLGVLLLAWPQFFDAAASYRDLDAIFQKIPMRSAVASCSVDPPIFGTRVFSTNAGSARVVAQRGGRAGISLVVSSVSPVQIRPEYRWDDYDVRTFLGACSLAPAHDLDRYGWVIARSRDADTQRLLVAAFAVDARLIAARGEWLLFQSTHEVAPLMSPEVPAPPGIQTAIERVAILAAATR